MTIPVPNTRSKLYVKSARTRASPWPDTPTSWLCVAWLGMGFEVEVGEKVVRFSLPVVVCVV